MQTLPKYEEVGVEALHAGDAVLVRYCDCSGKYTEEDWTVESVKARRYGKGTRYIVQWTGCANPDSYAPGRRFGRRMNRED